MKIITHRLLFLMLSLISVGYCAAELSPVGEASREDLSGCKLPNGIAELPEEGSPKARKLDGYIFSFKVNRLAFDPCTLADKRPSSFKEFRDTVIANKTGDIYFEAVGKDLFLLALSGRIKDLGQHFLYEFSGVRLAEPDVVFYTDKGETVPGVQPDVRLGNCYLMTTVDGQLVLLRVIRVDGDRRSSAIQWIKRAREAKTFEIPKGAIIEPTRKPETPGERAIVIDPIEYLKGIEQIKKGTEAHLSNRKRLIEYLMSILKRTEDPGAKETAKLPARIEKAIAVRVLGQMRAEEAASLLASFIDTWTPVEGGVVDADTVDNAYGCVPALVRIGKPGAAACLEAITKLTPEERKSPWKEKLLCLVIVRVEGEKIARLLLEERKETISSKKEQVENLNRALALIDEVKSW